MQNPINELNNEGANDGFFLSGKFFRWIYIGLSGVFLAFFVFIQVASAAPSSLTYQGRILKADKTPLEFNNVSFIFKILDPSGQCVIYQDQLNGIDMTGSGGIFDVPIGAGTVKFPVGGSFSVLDSFNNSPSNPFTCQDGTQFSPAASDGRLLRAQFFDGIAWQSIQPDNVIRSVPYAAFSKSSEKLGSYTATDFLLKAGLPACGDGTFLTWNGTNMTCASVAAAKGGTVTQVSSANSYITVANGNVTPVLTLNVGTTAGTVAAGDDSRLLNSLQSGSAAGGALAGTYPHPTLAANAVGNANIADGAVSTSKLMSNPGVNRILTTDSATGATVSALTCSAGQLLTWNMALGWQCSAQSSLAVGSASLAANFTGSLSGDVTGTQSATVVSKIGGYSVDLSVAPSANQVLTWDGDKWMALSLPSGNPGTVTSVSSSNGDIIVVNGSSAPVLTLNAGLGPNQVLKLDATGKLPAVDGSQLTNLQASQIPNLNASKINAGVLAVAQGGTGQSTYQDGQILIGNSNTNSLEKANLTAGSGVSILNGNGTITISATGLGGTVTSVSAGPGLTGGTITGSGTIGLGTELSGLNSVSSQGFLSRNGSGSYATTSSSVAASANTLVQRDGSGSSSFNGVGVSGASSGTVSLQSPAVVNSYSLTLPSDQGSSGQVLANNGMGILSWVNALTSNLGSGQIYVGNALGVATGVALSGDATINNSGVLTLANSGVVAGSYSKVTVDNKGRVTAGANLTSSDITTTLGFSPLNKAGDSMLGTLGLAQLATDPNTSGWGNSQKGFTWFNSTNNLMKYWDGSQVQSLGSVGASIISLNGQSGSAQTFATSSTGTDFSISSSGNVHTFNLPSASASNRGLLNSADWSTFNNKLSTNLNSAQIFVGNGSNVATGVAVSGDASLSNTGALTIGNNAITSAKINALAVTDAKINDVGVDKITSGANKYFTYKPNNVACSAGQILSWDAVNARWTCATDGGGTVTSVVAGAGLTGGTITGSGTIGLGTELSGLNSIASTGYLQRTGSGTYVTTAGSTGSAANTIAQRDGSGFSAFNGVGVSGSASGTVTLQSPATVTSYSLTYPSAQGAAGQVLSNNGTGILSWINALSSNLTSGQIYVGNASGVATGVALSGDASISNSGALTISNSAVSNAKMANMAAGTLKGNVSGSAAAPSDITIASLQGTSASTFAAGNDSRITGALQASGGSMSGMLTLATGTATLSPLRLPSGALVSTPVSGNIESDGAAMYWTNSLAARQKVLSYAGTPANGQLLIGNGSGFALGNISAGSGVTVTNSAGGISISATGLGGTVTTVSSANADIAVATGSSTPVLTLNSGTSANQIVKLDGSAKLPAVDGSALTNITTTVDKITNASAKYFDYRPNNVACSAGQVLQYTVGTGWVCATDGGGTVTSVVAGAGLTGGTITGSGTIGLGTELSGLNSISSTGYLQRTGSGTYVTTAGSTGSAANTLVQRDASGASNFSGVGVTGATSGTITIQAPATVTSYSLTYPSAQGAAGQVLSNNGTGILSWINALSSNLTSGQIYVGNASGVATGVALSGDASISNSGALTISNSAVSNAKMANMAAGTLKGNVSGSAAAPSDITIASLQGTSASTFAAGNDSRITGALQASGGSMSGMLTLATGTATLSPLRIPSGVLVTTPVSGNVESDGNFLYWTDSTATREKVMSYAGAAANGKLMIGNGTDFVPGNITAGSGVTVTNSAGGISISAIGSGGTVTTVSSANADIGVANGTATPVLTLNSGTSANQIVKLDGSAKLPAVDGSALTNITTTIDRIANAAAKYFDYKPNNVACTAGQTLQYTVGTGWVCSTPNAGTVTSIVVGTGLTGGTITGAGSIGLGIELTGVNGLSTLGYVQRTGSGTYSTLTGSTAAATNTLVQRDGSGVSSFYGVGVTGATSGVVTLQSPATVTSYSLTFPSSQGSAGQVLANNGLGSLSWMSALPSNLTAGQIFVGNASGTAAGVAMSGDATISTAGALTIANNAITSAKIADGAVTTTKALGSNPGINRLIASDSSTGAGLAKLECSTVGHVLSWTASTGWQCNPISSLYSAPVISVAGKTGAVSLASADITDASSANTANTLVKRDVSGNIAVGTITANTSVIAAGGSVAAPGLAFSGDTGTGLQGAGTGNIWVSMSGVTQWFWNASLFRSAATGGAYLRGNTADGTAINPAYTFTGDISTGVFRPAAGNVAVSVNGAEAMRVNASANVGIGTTAPAAKLDVAGGVKIGNDASACSAANGGTMKWTGTNLMFCDGTSWKVVSLTTPVANVVQISGSGAAMNVTGPGSPAYGTSVTFTYQNQGAANTATMSASLSSTTNFDITSDTCSGLVLTPNSQCSITVRPKASANGSLASNLVLNW